MGQKVNPHGLRVGVIKDWDSKWYAEKDFADNLVEDHEIRKFLKKRLYSAGISKIEIERSSDRVRVNVYTAKPGLVIGKGGAEIEKVKAEVQKMTDKKLFMDVKDVKRPDKDAQLVAENIAQQFVLVDDIAALTAEEIQERSVVTWTAGDSYYVASVYRWQDKAEVVKILQGIR